MEDIVIIGYGGHAKSVVDSIERAHKYRIVGYTELREQQSDYNYLGTDEALYEIYNSGVRNAVVGIGYLGKDNIRVSLYRKLKDIGFELPVIIDPSAIVSQGVSIGEGTIVGKNAVINSDSVIGKMAIINTGAIIEHESVIGDYVHVAVGAVVCGQATVGEEAFVGANSTIIQCRNIAPKSIIPAGMVIR